ncbi:MAG: ComF family protein [Candidatus Saganbacteria bacterium]|nr:ComF family protein [Candidatus Saganbacteria bacterium]
MDKLSNFLSYLLNFLFPSKCYVCGNIDGKPFCFSCQNKIKFICETKDNTTFITEYSGVIKKAIKCLKFRKKRRIAEVLGNIIAENAPRVKADCIIPVPLHENRHKQRGFNQSEMISGPLSVKLDAPVYSNVLIRKKETKPQFGLHKNERLKNIKGAFSMINRGMIFNKNIILIDDIYTTGATINECSKTLLDNGAKNVRSILLSKAVLICLSNSSPPTIRHMI